MVRPTTLVLMKRRQIVWNKYIEILLIKWKVKVLKIFCITNQHYLSRSTGEDDSLFCVVAVLCSSDRLWSEIVVCLLLFFLSQVLCV